MAEKSGNTGLAFIVGALVVVVGILAYLYLGGEAPGDADIEINLPASDG